MERGQYLFGPLEMEESIMTVAIVMAIPPPFTL